jgi:hypothetical protein
MHLPTRTERNGNVGVDVVVNFDGNGDVDGDVTL